MASGVRARGRWRAGLAAAAIALLPALAGGAGPAGGPAAGGEAVPGEVVVTLAAGAPAAAAVADLPAGARAVAERFAVVEATRLGATATYRLRAARPADPDALAAAFAAADGVVGAEPNRRFRPAAPPAGDPYAADQWHLAAIDAPAAWAITTGSPAVLVAVVDSGIDPAQPDLAGAVADGYDFVRERFERGDETGHGTRVASFITARTGDGRGLAGLAPGVRLLDYKVFSPRGASGFDIARGVIAAADAGARVINCSFEGGPTGVVGAAVAYAEARGAVVVAASGNGGTRWPTYPAAYPGVIAVGATDRGGAVSRFSSGGPHLALAAPGAGVLAAGSGAYPSIANGTSFAAPIVAGVAALMLSANPALTPAEVRRILEGTAEDVGPAGFDEAAGWGRVNAGRAVAAARDGRTAPNREAVIEGRVTGADPATVLIGVGPHGEVARPAADGTYRLPHRGRATYTLRATAASGAAAGPVEAATTGQPGEVVVVDLALAP